MDTAPVARKTVCIDDLRRRILTQDLEPGSYLDEVEIGETYGISRPPVREVLRQLMGEGYVLLHENRGAAEIYCRYCANEDGELRPREEVLGILTHWMQRWQGGLDETEARRRAERFMSAMPAWANT